MTTVQRFTPNRCRLYALSVKNNILLPEFKLRMITDTPYIKLSLRQAHQNYSNAEENDMNQNEIAYQNKDITSKVLAEHFKGKTFKVYGLDIPEIRQVLPTNIPTVKANELRLDNLFELADGTVAIVDYESEYKKEHKIKYLTYLTGIANRYLKEKTDCPMLRMIVIYTGDIKREQISDTYDIGAVRIKLEPAFLSELNSDEIFQQVKEKVEKNELLDDEEIMKLIIQPLSYRKQEEKEIQIRQTVELAVQIQDRDQQLFALSGILVFADKIIDMKTANKIRRAIQMTQVARIFEEEKQQALTQVAKIFEEEKQQALTQAAKIFEEEKQQAEKRHEEEKQQAEKRHEEEKQQTVKMNARQIVIRMIKKKYSTEEIVSLVSSFSQDDIEALRKTLEESSL